MNHKRELRWFKGQKRATQAKMDLHDLAEDLPIGWENILELANRTYAAYRDLTAARARLASFPGG